MTRHSSTRSSPQQRTRRLRVWVQRRDVQRAAATAFNAWLDEQGCKVSHGFTWRCDDLAVFDVVAKPMTKPEAVRYLTDIIRFAFECQMMPQGSA